jgi:glycosyltransferase involved in cell wall biosynthesis
MVAELGPLVTVVVPTHDRPGPLRRAVASALAQTMVDLEVVVVDDGSQPPVALEPDPRVRVLRHSAGRGLAASLNAGIRAARGRWIAHLDDDDVLLPHMLERSLEALATTTLPPPVIVVSGIEEVDDRGLVVDRRFPPTRLRGAHWSLEPPDPGCAYQTRNTMVAERQLLLDVGLYDEALRSSVRNDLFLRLNPVSSILGLREPTYQRIHHTGAHVGTDHRRKHESFLRLEEKHRSLYRSHRRGYARFLRYDAGCLAAAGDRGGALRRYGHAAVLAPWESTTELVRRRIGRLRSEVSSRVRRGPSGPQPPAHRPGGAEHGPLRVGPQPEG